MLFCLAIPAFLFISAACTSVVLAIDPCTVVPMKNGVPQPLVQGRPARFGAKAQLTERNHLVNGIDSTQFSLNHKNEKITSEVYLWSSMLPNDPHSTPAYSVLMDAMQRPNTMDVSCPNQGTRHVMYIIDTAFYQDEDGNGRYDIVQAYYGRQGTSCSIPFTRNVYPDQIHGQEIL